MILRDYQEESVAALEREVKAGEHPLLILPTGTGKTVVAAEYCRRNPGSHLFLAHTAELVNQAKNKIENITGMHVSLEQAENKTGHADYTTVASVQSLSRRLDTFRGSFVDIITDEAHRSLAKSYQKIYSHFGSSRIGITATPDRADDKSLLPIYTKIAYQYPLTQAIKSGHLSTIKAKRVTDFDIDLRDIKIKNRDLDETDLAFRIISQIHNIASSIIREMGDRKSLVFMPNVESSNVIADTLIALGVKAASLHGKLSKQERNDILYKFHIGKIQYLCSCDILIEGFDEPSISGIVMLRPTKSRVLYSQAIGRGTRVYDGKENMLLLEFTYNSDKLNLVKPYELFTQSGIEKRVQDKAKMSDGEEIDLLEEIEKTSKYYYSIDSIIERSVKRIYDFVYFEPLALSDYFGIDYFSELPVSYNGKQLVGMATEGQKNLLRRYSFAGIETMTKAQASMLLDKLREKNWYPTKGQATPKQIAFLSRRNIDARGMTKAHASILISLIKEKKENGK